MFLVAFELGWQAQVRAIKLTLLGAGVFVIAAAALAVTFEHHRLAEAFRTGEAEPLRQRSCGRAARRLPPAFASRSRPQARRTRSAASKGPTTVVSGFRGGVVKDANAAYRGALTAAGYTILRSEVDPADSEVVFRNGTTSGQVSMTQECKSRVRLRITIRPS